jgi:hypothetical protein
MELSNKMTALEKVQEIFNFSVDKLPLFGPENLPTPHYGLFRSDTGECVGKTCRKNYTPHTTDDVLSIMEAVQEVFGDCLPNVHFKNGHFVYMQPSKQERRIIAGMKDARYPDGIFPALGLKASFDGKAFLLNFGYYRDLCANLAFMKAVKEFMVRIRHSLNLRQRMQELIEKFSRMKDKWFTMNELIDQMAMVQTSLADFVQKVIGPAPTEKGSGLTRYTKRVEDIFKRVSSEHQTMGLVIPSQANNWQVSVWEAFNAIQGYVQHDMSRRGKVDQVQRIAFADIDSAGLIYTAEETARSLILAA